MSEREEIKNKSSPWIDQIQSFNELYREEDNNVNFSPRIKLGWIIGVLIPCLLSNWNVMLFIRLPMIVGNAGIFHSIIIAILSLLIILITNFSLTAISTNGKIKEGGLYFIISRSIGPEFGAYIGIILAFANIVLAANYTLYFCTFCTFLLKDGFKIDIIKYSTYIGVVYIIIIMSMIGCIDKDKEAKIHIAPLLAIVVAFINIIIGAYFGPPPTSVKEQFITRFDIKTFEKNWHSKYEIVGKEQQSFLTMFTKFFPYLTGIHSGLKYSAGDLKTPNVSIPKGTLFSILITTTLYIVLIVLSGSIQLREAMYTNNTHIIFDDVSFVKCPFEECYEGFTNALFYRISVSKHFIYIGVIAASISNTLSALIFGSKLLKRIGEDDVLPFLKYLAKGYGKSNEPYRAHMFAIIVSSSLFCIKIEYGVVSGISFKLTAICNLFAYAMLNLCTFHVAYFEPLGWRPKYKFYNKWLCLAAAVICISLMTIIDKKMSLIVGCVLCVLCIFARRKNEVINWGSSMQTQQLKTVIKNVYKADTIQYHIKNYLPSLIVFSGNPGSRKKLVSLANLITKNNGVQLCVNIEKVSLTPIQKKIFLDKGIQWLKSSGIKSLYVVIDNIKLDLAIPLIFSCGHGQLRPNIAIVGYKSDWLNCPYQDLQTYLNIFNEANIHNISTIMVRVSSTEIDEIDDKQNLLNRGIKRIDHKEDILCKTQANQNIGNLKKLYDCSVKIKNKEFSFESKKGNNGTVDVWWLYNDGGLSLIISSILKHSIKWKNCKFRIFGVTNKIECLYEEKHKLKQLLSLYRIHFDYLDIILTNTTGHTTITYFNSLLERAASRENKFDDYNLQKEHIAETLFLRDLIELHSLHSDLIILTTPNNNEENNILFMCWIETICRGLPPCIIINGGTDPVFAVNS